MIKEIEEQFTDGIRILMLCQRAKDGDKCVNKSELKKVSANKKEFMKIYAELKMIKDSSLLPLRIYSSVNRRDINKAIMNFKREQLEADFYSETDRNHFYFNIENRWISSLMKPSARAETQFLIDIDSQNSKVEEKLNLIGVKIIAKYPTKNGIHIITEPFNPNLLGLNFGEIKKDDLLLLDF